MKAIIGKKIGDVKVTRVIANEVFYSKYYWQGDFRNYVRCKCKFDAFLFMYPENCKA